MESVFCGGSSLPKHAHETPYFTFTLRGSYHERYGKGSRLCTPGTAVAHPAWETHSQEFGGDLAVLLRVSLNGAEAEDAGKVVFESPLYLNNSRIARTVSRLHRELAEFDAFSDAIVEGLGQELLALALQSKCYDGGSRRRALCARAFIHSSLECRLSLAAIAGELGVSRTTLYRDFKSAFGYGPGEYLRQARLKVAMSMLRRSSKPITEIAAWCGFFDHSHFDRFFRAATGASPSHYRGAAQ
ncbi:MAG: helix-turn-helix transcriptional regulator [Candidatus Eremiobacteraeota bacterium]|nr:helix-turn-helix transcriptional regulator [Candidatus Eremiobacteraeota bacterium]